MYNAVWYLENNDQKAHYNYIIIALSLIALHKHVLSLTRFRSYAPHNEIIIYSCKTENRCQAVTTFSFCFSLILNSALNLKHLGPFLNLYPQRGQNNASIL